MVSRRVRVNLILFALVTLAFNEHSISEPRTPKGGESVEILFGESQLVAIGKVRHIQTIREQKVIDDKRPQAIATVIRLNEAVIDLRRIYKGNSAKTIIVEFSSAVPSTSAAFGPELLPQETVLLFLNSSGKGAYSFSDREFGAYSLPDFHMPEARSEGIAQLQDDLAELLTGDIKTKEDALSALLAFREISPNTEKRLAPLVGDQDVRVSSEAYAVLLSTRKDQYYADVERFLQAHGQAVPGGELIVISGRLQDPGSSADPNVFDNLSNLPQPTIKLCAMYALRKLHSSKSVPTLIAHLSDPDPNIQYLSVITLNDIVHNGDDFGPTNYDFDKHPELYLARWQQWWQTVGDSEYAAP